ncbi:MAG: EscU/YscU/HrcU family type III secretion system export apparatus switch protein [Betaproteobacteria bacterium]
MESSQDRNLPASQRKLQKARDDGQVSRSRDLGNLAVLGTGAVAMTMMAPMLMDHLIQALSQQLTFNASTVGQTGDLLTRLHDVTLVGMGVAVAFAALILPAVLISTVATGGWVMSMKPLIPDFSRLNPLAGFGRLFSREQVAQVGKLVLMTVALIGVATSFFMSHLDEVAQLVMQPSAGAIPELARWVSAGVGAMLLVVLALALIDMPLQAFMFGTRMRMSHEEVKQEHKDSDGNPQMKGRLRARQKELAQRNSVGAVAKADFVVMNPTHFAVALKYDESRMGAPQVVSKGADLLALKIRDLAKSNKVPVLESPMLARALYTHAELNQEIPGKLYTAVAQVLAYVYKLKAALKGEGPMPEQMPEPWVPPEMDPFSTSVPEVASS